MADAELQILLKLQDQMSAALKNGPQKSVSDFGSTLNKVGTIAAGFLAAGAIQAGFQKFTGFLQGSTQAAKEAALADAQLDAVLKSTSNAIGYTADQLKKMATGFENSTNFADEQVQGAESLLLTFTNIGHNVFPAATAAVLDMSQALGQDLKSSSIQLGKALNDPITGLTALRRVGVSFDDQQKKMIKTMVAAGDTAGAQRLILNELNKEFGGSAAAAVKADGGITQLKNKINDMQEVIGAKMLPLQVKFEQAQLTLATAFVNHVIPAIQSVIGIFSSFRNYLTGVAKDGDTLNDWLTHLPGPLRTVAESVGDLYLQFQNLSHLFQLGFAGGEIGGQFSTLQKAAFEMGAFFRTTLVPAFHDAEQSVHLFFLALQGGDAGGNLSSMQTKFLALGASVRQMWEVDIKPALSAFADIVKTVVKAVIDNWGTIGPVLKFVADFMIARIEGMLQAAKGMVEVISGVVQLVADLFHGRWQEAWNDLVKIAGGVIDILIGTVKEQFGNLPDILWGLGKSAVQGFIDGVGSLKGAVEHAAADVANSLTLGLTGKLGIHSPSTVMHAYGVYTMQGYANGITDGFDKYVGSALGAAVASVKSSMASLVNGGTAAFISGGGGAVNTSNYRWSGSDPGSLLPQSDWVPGTGPTDWRNWSGDNQGTLLARASGGPVSAGMAYTVGENGPETLVMGGQSGSIVPNGGRGLTINIVINNAGSVLSERDLMRVIRDNLQGGALRGYLAQG